MALLHGFPFDTGTPIVMDFDFDAWLASTSNRRQWLRQTLVSGGAAFGLAACGSGGSDGTASAEAAAGGSAGSGGTAGTGGVSGGAATSGSASGARVFKHPGLLHTEADFTRMRAQLAAGREPWVAGFRALTSSGRAQLGRDPQPVVTAIRGGDGENFRAMVEDVQRAYQLALRWKVSGDTAYADQAVRYINAWVSTMTTLTGNGDRFLAAGIYGYQWANAAEILRTYSGWSATDIAACQKWLMANFYPLTSSFLKDHNATNITNQWANWDLVSLAGMLAIGVFADRADVYQEALDYFNRGRGNGASQHMVYARHPGHMGQWQESGRDQGHSTLSLGMAGYLCEMAWNQGDDLYGMDDNRLLAGAEYVAKSNLKDAAGAFYSLPFYVYINRQGTFTAVSDGGRPNGRPCWEPIYNHYVKRKGPGRAVGQRAGGAVAAGGQHLAWRRSELRNADLLARRGRVARGAVGAAGDRARRRGAALLVGQRGRGVACGAAGAGRLEHVYRAGPRPGGRAQHLDRRHGHARPLAVPDPRARRRGGDAVDVGHGDGGPGRARAAEPAAG